MVFDSFSEVYEWKIPVLPRLVLTFCSKHTIHLQLCDFLFLTQELFVGLRIRPNRQRAALGLHIFTSAYVSVCLCVVLGLCCKRSLVSSVGMAVRLWGGRLGNWVSIHGRAERTYVLTTESLPALGPTQPPIQYILGVLFRGTKWQGREPDH
jgi:hypothetical protein